MTGPRHLMTRAHGLSRRGVLTALGGTALAMLTASGHAAEARTWRSSVRGRILDADRTAMPRALAGVMVSNGRDVVLTNSKGYYALPVEDGDFVFAIKPPHWTYEEAAGMPSLGYRVTFGQSAEISRTDFVPSVSAGSSNCNFSFRSSPEPDAFDVLLFTDTHAGDSRELGFVRDMIAHGRETTRAAFALHHGDALADDLGMFGAYRDMLGDSGLVWHHCPGNHDMRLGLADPNVGLDAWVRNVGPAHYAFRSGKATFILLNNIQDLGPNVARHDPRPYRGFISRDQLTFVANVLRHVPRDDLVVVSLHIPLASYLNPSAPTDTTVNAAALMRLLSGRPNTISFAGHSHTTEHHYLGMAEGFIGPMPHHHQVLTAACGSWWSGRPEEDGLPSAVSRDGSPKGHHVLSIKGTRAQTRFVPYRPEQQVRALIEERRLLGVAGLSTAIVNGRLVVNVFDGGPKTKVACRIGETPSAPIPLQHTASEDPFIVDSFARDREFLKPWVHPARCSHLWTLDLPGDLKPGPHSISIETIGEFGQRHDHEVTIHV